ncbi:MAG TPA: ABC transporter permease [Parafilimonas sp.]|nr:ABC transporter permease [Parafilimonas sp.]
MFRNYFKTAWRNLKKRKAFSAINIVGLAIGMCVCMLLALYIQNELGYDKFQENRNQIYRLAVERIYPNRTSLLGEVPESIGQAVKREFPEVLESVRIVRVGKKVNINNKIFDDEKVFGADSNFFKVFTVNLIQGTKYDALQKPQTAVINESTAKRFFGSAQNAMGKHILINGFNDCMINGVCKDWPSKSHFQFTILVSNSSFNLNQPDYYDFSTYTYLLLNKNASATALEARLPSIVTKYVAPTIQKGFGESFEAFTKEGNGYKYFLQPLQQIHLHSNLQDELEPTTSIDIIYLAAIIGLFILFLACINFINLSTAISVERAREIGVRKTFGSDKKSIVWQFLCESVLFSLISVALGILLARLLLPLLNSITGSGLSFFYFFNPTIILIIFCIAIFIGGLAGLYPALVLSSFRPIAVLKGRFKSGARGVALRNGLVVFQFAISIFLIIGTIVINSQMQFMLGSKLGFKKDNIIAVRQTFNLQNNRQAFVDEVRKMNGVQNLSFCNDVPQGDPYPSCAMQAVETKLQRTDRTTYVDEQYQNVFGLQLVSGRFFSKDFPTDSTAFILNEAAVKDFGLTNPIGSHITSTELNFNPPDGKSQTVYTVIGVVKDYHFESLHQKIAPLILANAAKFGAFTAAIKINGTNLSTTLPAIEKTWKDFNPKDNFKYSFVDDIVAQQYKAEQTAQKIFTAFAILAILIACIGLFGLVMYATFQRTKEISVRKILGATAGNIVLILSKDFMRLIIISGLITVPVAVWATHAWLQNFAYRINVNWWVFAIAILIVAGIAFLTISFQAIKAAIANPVKSLRTE